MSDQVLDIGKSPSAAVLLNKNRSSYTNKNYNSKDKDKMNVDYVK